MIYLFLILSQSIDANHGCFLIYLAPSFVPNLFYGFFVSNLLIIFLKPFVKCTEEYLALLFNEKDGWLYKIY